MTPQEFFFQTWSREMPKFDSVMDALDPARLDYRPHPKSRSAAEMVTLLARFQEMLVGMMETGVIDYKDFQTDDYDEMRARVVVRQGESKPVVVHSGRDAPRADGCRAQAGKGRRPQRALSLHFCR